MQVTPEDRFNWAIKIMDVKPADKILEIGCGSGIAIEKIASILTTGKITAIDRSAGMVEKAARRNLQSIKTKKADVVHVELLNMKKRAENNKAFCFNINFFWTKKSIKQEAYVLKENLASRGLLYIFYGPLFENGLNKIKTPVVTNLATEKLKLINIIHDKSVNCCCFISTVAD